MCVVVVCSGGEGWWYYGMGATKEPRCVGNAMGGVGSNKGIRRKGEGRNVG